MGKNLKTKYGFYLLSRISHFNSQIFSLFFSLFFGIEEQMQIYSIFYIKKFDAYIVVLNMFKSNHMPP